MSYESRISRMREQGVLTTEQAERLSRSLGGVHTDSEHYPMSNAIRFNHKNQWHFAMNVDHPYGFAFTDWRFDPHGFPRLP